MQDPPSADPSQTPTPDADPAGSSRAEATDKEPAGKKPAGKEQASKEQAGPAPRRRRAGAGRPRDAALEEKVFDAAVRVYSATGWAGFSIERIARTAGVGKAAIYSRWSDRRDILRATFERRWEAIDEIDEGSLRGDLRALITTALSRYLDNRGAITLHMQIDGLLHPEFREMAAPFSARTARPMLRMLARAQERGEMARDIRRSTALLMIMGPIVARFARIEPEPREITQADLDALRDELVPLIERALAPTVPDEAEGRPARDRTPSPD